MSEPVRIFIVLALVAGIFAFRGFEQRAPAPADVGPIPPGPLTFAPGVRPGHQDVVRRAIASVRPEAQRLVAAVDGMVTFDVADTGDAVGYTESVGRREFKIVVDLDRVYGDHGNRGIVRTVLHEFGHVVDRGLLPEKLKAELDAGIPAGYRCEPGEPTGSCATREERFAESFAKWAMDDIGADIYIGYKVPPPAMTLEDWGRPLAALAP